MEIRPGDLAVTESTVVDDVTLRVVVPETGVVFAEAECLVSGAATLAVTVDGVLFQMARAVTQGVTPLGCNAAIARPAGDEVELGVVVDGAWRDTVTLRASLYPPVASR